LAEGGGRAPEYKVVEIAEVSDARIEEALNLWSGRGFGLESVHFAMQPGSRRPSMAFLFFSRREASRAREEAGEGEDA
jgi:hypothetical protein